MNRNLILTKAKKTIKKESRENNKTDFRRCFLPVLIILVLLFISGLSDELRAQNPEPLSRSWLGPDYFASPFEDWQLSFGKIVCRSGAANRYVYFLTREIDPLGENLEVSFRAKLEVLPRRVRARNYLGLRLGIKAESGDYREAALRGQGLDLGITTEGLLFVGDLESVSNEERLESIRRALVKEVFFKVLVRKNGEKFRLTVSVMDPATGKMLDELEDSEVPSEKISGGLALVSNLPEVQNTGALPVCQFYEFKTGGDMLKQYEERRFGPVAFTLYSLSRRGLRLSAQLIPGCVEENSQIFLEVKEKEGWKLVSKSCLNRETWQANFQVSPWFYEEEVEFRVRVESSLEAEQSPPYHGRIRKEPFNEDKIRLAVLSQLQEQSFPYRSLVLSLKKLNPDVLFFAGNQVYGRPAQFWREKFPLEKARQEYFRQWLLFGWAFSDLLKDRPAILLPEARDFFQLKLWGEGGRQAAAENGTDPISLQDRGGFLMPEEFIRLVLATQTGHLPPASLSSRGKDNEAVGTGFNEVNYAGLSLAVVNDRIFKSAPAPLLPEARIKNGWPQNPSFDLKKAARVKEARLLSEEQLRLLKEWVVDWSDGVWFKACLSSSAFVSLLTLPEGQQGEEAIWQLSPLKPGEHPESDRPAADFHTGGWPQPARDEIVSLLRQARAVHLCGTGGPPAVLKYGLEKPGDATVAMLAPPIQAQVAVRWTPAPARKSRGKKESVATGNWEDAFGNKFNLLMVNNPTGEDRISGLKSISGFSLVTFEKTSRQVIFESYQLEEKPEVRPVLMPGWPVVLEQKENDGRKPVGYLPLLKFSGLKNPVIQVIEEKSGETVYCFRISGAEFRPPVYKPGVFSVKCGEPGTEQWKVLKGLRPQPEAMKKTLHVNFNSPPENQVSIKKMG
ncbi:MAG: hypothetical protein H5U07_05385 [Candidatus Aminicenantes bacterium]|nr:hypothetical protein [Candidatus Aminicenantes bacterium]